jgi:transposase
MLIRSPIGRCVAAVAVVAQTCPWRDVPGWYGSWQRIYGLFRQWQRDGTWAAVISRLQAAADASGGSIVRCASK